jgi:large subunit ribosomal protein L24
MTNTQNVKFSIRKNDQVQVISGREKGKTGKVLHVNRSTGRVTVEKLNMVKRHTKPTQKLQGGGIIEKELPLHYSNVLLFCAKCNRGVRHGNKILGEQKTAKPAKAAKGAKTDAAAKTDSTKKVRVCKRCDTQLDAV